MAGFPASEGMTHLQLARDAGLSIRIRAPLFLTALAIWGVDAVMVEKLDAAFPDAWKAGYRLDGR
jgi:hypothetical protein